MTGKSSTVIIADYCVIKIFSLSSIQFVINKYGLSRQIMAGLFFSGLFQGILDHVSRTI